MNGSQTCPQIDQKATLRTKERRTAQERSRVKVAQVRGVGKTEIKRTARWIVKIEKDWIVACEDSSWKIEQQRIFDVENQRIKECGR